MILEIIVGIIAAGVISFVGVKLYDDYRMKKIRNNCNKEEDKGRRVEDFYNGSNRGSATPGKQIIREDVRKAILE